jgi:hypothetical protein
MFPFGNTRPIFYEELTYSADIKYFDNLIIKLTHSEHIHAFGRRTKTFTKEMVAFTHKASEVASES